MFPLRICEISHAPDLLQLRSQCKHLLASIIYEIGFRLCAGVDMLLLVTAVIYAIVDALLMR